MADIKELVQQVSANPALVQFPTDRWGFTSAVRREVLKQAAMVRGQKDKHDLLVGTLAILLSHVQKRFPVDQANRLKYEADIQKFAQERAPREINAAKTLAAK